MSDSLADRVRTIIAAVGRLPPAEVQFTSTLVEDLGIDGLARITIGCEIETVFGLAFDAVDQETETSWSTVADVIATAERLLRAAPIAGTSSGRAA
jgi:acyl carrier protein